MRKGAMGMTRDESGFTLIELLVVIVIIAILASIAIPVFLNQRERAWDAQSRTTLKNAATSMEAAAVNNQGVYRGIEVDDLVEQEGLKYSPVVTILRVESANDAGFCLSVEHRQSDETIFWDSAEGQQGTADCSAKYL